VRSESRPTSGRSAPDALTLIRTCKRMGINPRAYLRDTLAAINEDVSEAAEQASPKALPGVGG
jgi:hypothetical protein